MYEDLKGQLADCQHSFVKGRSTVSNLLEYSSFLLKSIEDGCQVDSNYTDFSNAFDKMHRIKCLILVTSSVLQGSHLGANLFHLVFE
jgi:hypothetical protein